MTRDKRREIDPELKKDLTDIIKNVEEFAREQDSVLTSFLRQRRLPELFESGNN